MQPITTTATRPLPLPPLISFEDANRKQSSPDGTWYEMDTITLQSGEGGVTTFNINAQTDW